MTLPAPPIDSRTSREFVQKLEQLLKEVYTAEWKKFRADRGASRALIEIFGRLGELITERLNQVPEKNLLAFLDMIGASLLPPQPARVPLTFSLVSGSIVGGLVLAGTQVAAVQAEGETAPVIFETESELAVTAAQLMALFVRRPEQRKYADYSFLVNSVAADGVPAFLGNQRLEHIFYLGHDMLFSYPRLQQLQLDFQATKPPASFQAQWEKWDGAGWTVVPASLNADGSPVTTDGSKYLTRDGHLYLKNVASIPRHTIAGFTQSWLRCRLLTPIAPASRTPGAAIRNDQLPELTDISMKATIGTTSNETLPIEAAFSNTMQVDATQTFLPFGEKPKIGDTLYLASEDAFSEQGATVTLNINLSSRGAGANPQLSWEFWDGQMWRVLDKDFSDTTKAFTKNGTDGNGGLVRFTFPGQPVATNVNGVESFWVRVRLVYGNYGEEAHYQLIDKNDPSKGYAYIDNDPGKGYIVVPATFKPPAISSIAVRYALARQSPPEVVLSYNNGPVYKLHVFPFKPFKPFQGDTDAAPTLYLGFRLPPGLSTFPNRKVSVYVALAEFKQGENLIPLSPGHSRRAGKSQDNPSSKVTHTFIVTNPTTQTVEYLCVASAGRWATSVPKEISVAPGTSQDLTVQVTIPDEAKKGESDRGFLTLKLKSAPAIEYNAVFETYVGAVVHSSEQLELVWQYWNGAGWSELSVRDYTENLNVSGLIEFLAPTDFNSSSQFGLSGYWLRVIWTSGEYVFDPRLRGLLLNTTTAAQAVTIKDEILGSSDGSNRQVFKTTRAPILEGQQLYVREPEIPPADELEKLEETESDALQVVTDDTGRPKEIWVRWSQRPDFYGSAARDRHYVLDNLTGEVLFGDGQNGLIPPVGVGNIRMSLYRNGGGSAGNKPAGAITQLKTTVPYVEKVVNHLPATDGTDAETTASLLERAPRLLRHGQRAVTVEDYEDMAGLASPEVARAKCIPLVNVIEDTESGRKKVIKPGIVSLIIVPRSTDDKPSPGSELIARVQDFVGQRQSPTAELIIAGPKFIRIDVKADVAPVSLDGASQVKLAIVQALASYLHPLTGGMDGNGWDFGRYPHVSNLYALVEAIEGVDHVRSLKFDPEEESDKVKKAGKYFLVYSGMHTINLRFGEN